MSEMGRRTFMKFLTTYTAVRLLPATGAHVVVAAAPKEYFNMYFEDPVVAPPLTRFSNCAFSARASAALPPNCDFFACHYEGTVTEAGFVVHLSASNFASIYIEGRK